ncbi:MAG: DUF4168 domain-containing protein, partial [Chitinivibrionales bacterium]
MVRIVNTGVVLRTLLTLVVLVGFTQCQGNNDADTPDAEGKADLDQSPSGEMTEVTDEELQMFAEVNQQMQGGSQQMQVEMKGAIEEQGLEPDKYNEIAKKMQETKGKAPSVSDENKEKAEKASDKMKEIQ